MMFALAINGIVLAASLVIGLILLILFAFFGNIIIFDCVLSGVIAGICCNVFFSWHPALCLLLGIVLFFALLILHNTSVGFWIIGSLMTVFYTLVAGYITYSVTSGDWIWVCIISILAFLLVAGLHFSARDDLTI